MKYGMILALVVVVSISSVFAGTPGCGAKCKSGGSKCAMSSAVGCAVTKDGSAAAMDKASPVSGYPVDVCVVSGEKLSTAEKPVTKMIDGREVRFCCNGCVATYEKDKATYSKKLDDAIVAAQKPTYPLQTCVVSGEKLGGMGQPVDYVVKNQLVRLCCGGCIDKLTADPDKYLAMVKAPTAPAAEPVKTESPK